MRMRTNWLFVVSAALTITGAAVAATPRYRVIYRFQGGRDGYFHRRLADSPGATESAPR